MLTATSHPQPLPSGTEGRLEQFAHLVAAALGHSQARTDRRALADEQTALRTVAELAARGASTDAVLEEVAAQGSRLAGVDFTTVLRYADDGATEVVAIDGAPDGVTVGMRAQAGGQGAVQAVWRTGHAARVDDLTAVSGRWPGIAAGAGYTASLAVPILLDGALWGALVVVARQPLPDTNETHLANFADLVGTAIAAAQSRTQLGALADEQAALRRVAELVARGPAPGEVFVAIANETSALLDDLPVALMVYDADADGAVVVATCNCPAPIGLHVPFSAGTAVDQMFRTGRPAHVDSYQDTTLAGITSQVGIVSTTAVPIMVEGRVRATLVSSNTDPAVRAAVEARLTQFAELAAVAIANAETKAELIASRARVVATADETRRRLQRDVHDGAQQRLVHTIIALKLARNALADESTETASALVDEALANAERANHELRDIVHGILPASLTRSGLRAGLESLVADLTVPVEVTVRAPRLPAPIETTAYFIVAEALTNVVKHAKADRALVQVGPEDGSLIVEVRDDGVGGVDPTRGTGLIGLLDRVDAAEGVLTITSPPGSGTTVRARLPMVATVDERGRSISTDTPSNGPRDHARSLKT
ncbi:GAF domain-containing sensor histidine kinase [Actinomycetospora endophytica]|uniref:histidine kinase n=2 Tax=Actinomycetospora endophytica TaxID=2291215 RepID=A0ABS8PED9_9PSEU|nr:GAF domain-containing sensor histidine kinase [Actinomycetospora endophytica]MCD2195860.1 GAF domain-containing sensor histidine kinase [Actinomycetospora endophytica]